MSNYTTILLSCCHEDARTAVPTMNRLLNDKRWAPFMPFPEVVPGLFMFGLRKNWIPLETVIDMIEAVPWRDVVQVWSKEEEYADRFTEAELNPPRIKTAYYMDCVWSNDGERDARVEANSAWQIKSRERIIPALRK